MRKLLMSALVIVLLGGWTLAEEKKSPAPAKEKPRVEVVFVLDTTGSMSSLIEGAKRKIWSIADRIVSGKPTPDVRIGLVAYRDRGDAYVTKRFDLTGDVDAVFRNLSTLSAGGGGDGPESVNQALFEAVHKMSWTPNDRPLKIIFLVGDAPPHMDYAQDVQYPATCLAALKASIQINTVQCGGWAETGRIWREIALSAEGSYIAIDQSGGMVSVESPYDKKLAELSRKMSGTYVAYGSEKLRRACEDKLEEAEKGVAATPTPAPAAARAGFRAKSGRVGANDLIALLIEGKVKPEDLDPKKLPEALAKMPATERTAHLQKLVEERKTLQKEIRLLAGKRDTYVKEWLAKNRKKDSFDGKVLEALKKAAEKKGIEYKD
jgi:Mg-chelatase subunit ChlD